METCSILQKLLKPTRTTLFIWKTGTLKFNTIKVALELSLNLSQAYAKYGQSGRWLYLIGEEQQVTEDLIQNILVVLFDGSLIKAKVTASSNIVLSKTDTFPNVRKLYNLNLNKMSAINSAFTKIQVATKNIRESLEVILEYAPNEKLLEVLRDPVSSSFLDLITTDGKEVNGGISNKFDFDNPDFLLAVAIKERHTKHKIPIVDLFLDPKDGDNIKNVIKKLTDNDNSTTSSSTVANSLNVQKTEKTANGFNKPQTKPNFSKRVANP
ncbi:unnamed protein product [Ambrosiozyma monospora]|uniref:Unnamed protein product n=1 Tax=Ambrosiozyma monospora TaxID=43982 RepID=A0ACB5SZB4_AMBMO|nr:unnamed protein product [Ambrosiozyma monospora]